MEEKDDIRLIKWALLVLLKHAASPSEFGLHQETEKVRSELFKNLKEEGEGK